MREVEATWICFESSLNLIRLHFRWLDCASVEGTVSAWKTL